VGSHSTHVVGVSNTDGSAPCGRARRSCRRRRRR